VEATTRRIAPAACSPYALVWLALRLDGRASLACTDLPACGGAWWRDADWPLAFRLDADPGADGLVAMHWAHRLGAFLVVLAVAALARRLLREPGLAGAGWLLLGLLAG